MAVLTSQGTLPASGAEMTAAPLTDTINHIINTLNGNNLDENNVDYSSVDGVVVKGQANTITGLISHENTSAASGGVRTALKVGVNPGSGTAADNDGVEVQFYGDDDGGNATVFAEVETLFTDVSNGSEDADLVFKTVVAGTLTEVFRAGASGVSIGSLGVAFGDDEKLNFGTGTDYWFQYDATGTNFELQSTNTNGSGADGDILVVQDGTNDVAFAGGIGTDGVTAPTAGIKTAGGVVVGQDGTGHDVQFFGDTSGQYMLWDQSADELVLAGDSKLSFHDAAGGENIIATSDGHLEVNAGTTLDITAPTVDLNSATEFNIDTAAYDLNASGAVTIDSAGVSIDSSSASNFTTSGGALTLTSAVAATWSTAAGALTLTSAAAATWSTSAGALTVNGTGGVNIQEGGADIVTISDARALATANTASINLDASGVVAIESSGGTISVGDDNVDQTINLATKGTRTLNVGINDGTDVTTLAVKGNTTNTGTITVGEDDTGYDVKLFGATSGKHMLWDEDQDTLQLTDSTNLTFGTGNDADIFYDGTDLNISPAVVGSGDIVVNGASIEFADSEGVTLGTGKDATIQYDGTNLVISPAAVGSGDVSISGGGIKLPDSESLTLGTGSDATIQFDATNTVYNTAGYHSFTGGDVHVGNGQGLVIGHTAQISPIGTTSEFQVLGTSETDGSAAICNFANNNNGAVLTLGKARGGAIGTYTVVADDDKCGTIKFGAADGTDLNNHVASIIAYVDGTPGGNDTPGRLTFNTTSDGAGSSSERMRINNNGNVFIGDTANSEQTRGLTIHMDGNDDNILDLKAAEVAHGRTSHGETDTFFSLAKYDANKGGCLQYVLMDNEAQTPCYEIRTTGGQATTSKTQDGCFGLMQFRIAQHDGSNAANAMTADGVAFAIRCTDNTGNDHAIFAVDEDGDVFAGNGTAMTDMSDDKNDPALLRGFDHAVDELGLAKGMIKNRWDDFVKTRDADLVELGVLGDTVENGGLYCVTQHTRLMNSAIWQVYSMLLDVIDSLPTETQNKIRQVVPNQLLLEVA